MLPKENRLNLEKDFKRVAAGKKIETKFAKLFVKMDDNANPRIGIAVSGKVFKKASDRNRARRVISQALQSIFLDLPKNINILALPKHSVLEVKSGEVLMDLRAILKHEKIIN